MHINQNFQNNIVVSIITLINGARSEGSKRTSGTDEIPSASLPSEKSNGTPAAGGYKG
jgi:hypothetical protein